jgi:hypothetical protein
LQLLCFTSLIFSSSLLAELRVANIDDLYFVADKANDNLSAWQDYVADSLSTLQALPRSFGRTSCKCDDKIYPTANGEIRDYCL